MAEQKEIGRVQSECETNLFNLVYKAREFPQIVKIGLVDVIRTQLVIVVVLDAGGGKIGIACFEVLMRATRPAVQQQQFDTRVVADALSPDLEYATRRRDRDASHSACTAIGTRGIVQIVREGPGGGRVMCACSHIDPWAR